MIYRPLGRTGVQVSVACMGTMTFGWEPQRVALVLGAAYVGYLDDLAVFDRPLTDGEVRYIHQSAQGIAGIR